MFGLIICGFFNNEIFGNLIFGFLWIIGLDVCIVWFVVIFGWFVWGLFLLVVFLFWFENVGCKFFCWLLLFCCLLVLFGCVVFLFFLVMLFIFEIEDGVDWLICLFFNWLLFWFFLNVFVWVELVEGFCFEYCCVFW